MSEIVEFDIAYQYSQLKVGIVLETTLRFGNLQVEIDARALILVRAIAYSNGSSANDSA